MGTRADFYIGRGEQAEWLGSIAWDGYPSGIPNDVLGAADAEGYRNLVMDFLRHRDDATLPEMGWPWPWNDSNITDYSYAFDDGRVYVCCFGSAWWSAGEDEPEREPGEELYQQSFPNMAGRRSLARGVERSGMMTITTTQDGTTVS